ncbi:MAG: 50S ribosomal protein L21 [Candidatus Omnitrophica bacterium]|nr:50S ribosomal protein L21 [Candidatus Omnitrophota bacterium]
MYAFIEIAGKQIKVKEGSKFSIFRLKDKKAGDEVKLKPVCIIENEKIITSKKELENFNVICEVVEEKKGKKLYVFRKTAKTGYKRGIGHRDRLTVLKVKSITRK